MKDQIKNSITLDMTIEEIFSGFPHKSQRLAQEMTNFGLHCVGCHASTWETLEAGMLGHGMNQDAMDTLVSNLNGIIDESYDPKTVTITEFAAKKYLDILENEGKSGWGIRFKEKPSGCNGFEYLLDFSEKSNDDDEVVVSQGIEIHMQKESVSRLKGSHIDYIDGLQGAGFKISNPNVRSSCHCGTSHGY